MNLSSDNWIFHVVLAIPVFVILYSIINRFRKTITFKLSMASFGTLILTPLLYSALLQLFFAVISGVSKRKFNKESWLNEPSKRYEMVDNLIKKKILIGKDSNQIKEILGTTSSRSDSNNYWLYNMGMGTAFLGFAFHNLEVEFSGSRVVNVRHHKYID